MYRPEFHPKVDKDISKFDKGLRKAIRDNHIPQILKNPHTAGRNLTGDLAGLKSYHFTANRVEYRIVYEIVEKEVVVLFIMAGTRENFYQRLLKRLLRK